MGVSGGTVIFQKEGSWAKKKMGNGKQNIKYEFDTLHIILQKKELSIKDFFIKCDEIRSLMRIWSHLLKKYLMENFIFFVTVYTTKP